MFPLCLRSPSQIRTAVRSLQPIFRAFLLPSFLLLAYSSQLQAEPVEEPIIELIEELIEEPIEEPVEEPWEAAAPEADDPKVNWLDGSQGYLTDQTQILANWMDSFFGDSDYDSEQAESIIRIELEHDWNSEDGSSFGSKIRGRVHMPRLSKRLSLVFSGDEEQDGNFSDTLPGQQEDDRIGFQFAGRETSKSRFDYTLGWSKGHLRPGIKYRRQGELGEKTTYRLTERIQYEHEKNIYSRTNFRISRLLTNNSILNWSSRLVYGERTLGVEWATQFSMLYRYKLDDDRPIAISYFVGASGVTRPDSYASNYSAGLLYRRQFMRDYLFLEFEPSANYRKLTADDGRELFWRAVLKLEIAISKQPLNLI